MLLTLSTFCFMSVLANLGESVPASRFDVDALEPEDEINKREEILANYQKVVAEIESKYAEEERQITESKKKSVKKK